ncbi:uncharacterized protein LOC117305635 [Asterias rubens]|uniref:uncharacterized protein LOC117305635 n=1 Tax=Asterias rubens TaxID=7604 RepID=UPI001455B0EB|nr:uncharacterized protein LOC117305635 [Asterias rubens]
MDSRQLESSSSESELDLHDVEEKIRDILPNIKRRRLASFLEYLQKMGVESVNDLVYINERDISQTLTPIEARRLLDHLNCRPPVESGSQNRPVKATLELDDSSSSRSSSSSATDESSQSSVEIAVGNPFPSRSSAETGSTRVPWQKMPRLLMAALEAKRRPAPSLRKEMIRIIVDDLDKPSTSLPRTKVLRALSSEIVQRFPDSFIDELGGEKVGSGYDSLLSQAMLNKANCALLDVIEDWPYLFDEKFMLMHFKELVGTDIMHKVQESFKDKIPKILRFLKQHSSCLRNKQLQDTLQQLEAAVDVVGNKSPQVIGLITVLCAYFGEDRGCHILSTEELEKPVFNKEDLPGNPCLLVNGKLLEANKWSLAIGQLTVADVDNPITALCMLFGSYYIFNLQYPATSAGVMEFIQRCLVGINPQEGTKGGQKKTAVHAGLLKLTNALKSFEWNV